MVERSGRSLTRREGLSALLIFFIYLVQWEVETLFTIKNAERTLSFCCFDF